LIPLLVALAEDPVWRVREKVISQLPLLTQSFGKVLFQEKLLPLYLGCFQDQVHAVRMTATRCAELLTQNLGEAWASAHLLPRLAELFSADGSPYLQRITALIGMRMLCVPGATAIGAEVLAHILKATQDSVPNVRAVAANVLGDVGAAGVIAGAAVRDSVRPALKELLADRDSDVRYAAELAIEKIEAVGL
jgi:serine/threonine-protein phosphatase 2A regulatory subunit A